MALRVIRMFLASTGMGGSLNPPTHPEHTRSVVEKYLNGHECGSMSLSFAARMNFAPAQHLLEEWKAPPIESEVVQQWVRQILGYFKDCYRNPIAPEARQWDADKMVISPELDPMKEVNEHAGVHHIRKFYPDFAPTPEQFAEARWG